MDRRPVLRQRPRHRTGACRATGARTRRCSTVVRSNRYLLVTAIALVCGVVGLYVVYIGTWLPLQLHLDTSHARVVSQLHACTIVWLAAVIAAIRGGAATG